MLFFNFWFDYLFLFYDLEILIVKLIIRDWWTYKEIISSMIKKQTNKTILILFFFQNSCHNRYRSSDYKGVDVIVLIRIVITASSPLSHAHMHKDKCL